MWPSTSSRWWRERAGDVVERLNRDPRVVAITEAEVREPPPPRQGLCLVCGEWLEADDRSFGVSLTSPSQEHSEHVAHPACIGRVVHPSARVVVDDGAPLVDPVPPAAAQPDNYLAGKYRTPSGR
ncbi:MAG: hypothetical protein QOI71_341 [Gaiellales bacterium]|jgi:hypothetical protein|nr:hypothetical protein [Gaiellales bacterium]